MKALFLFIVLLSSTSHLVAIEHQQGELKVTVNGAKNNNGKIEVHLFNNKAQFKNKIPPLLICKAKIKRLKSECTFKDITYGSYGVFSFHDENQNGNVDFSLFGDPQEKLAISGVDLVTNSDPIFKDSQFLFNSQRGQIFINLQ
ncbi:MAG: hypothetical protein ACI9LM_000401 [Alteromonadaceae bacterium]|jgi:uncharacterized protein (DUF2141 family)